MINWDRLPEFLVDQLECVNGSIKTCEGAMSKKECLENLKLYATTVASWHDNHPDIKGTNPRAYFATQGGFIGRRTFMHILSHDVYFITIYLDNESGRDFNLIDDNSMIQISTYGMTMEQKQMLEIPNHVLEHRLWCLRPEEYVYGFNG